MEDNLIALLESFKLPVIRQGSLAPDEAYPDTFFTFWNSSEAEQSAYSNETASVVYTFQVNVYSTNPGTTYSQMAEVRQLLKANGWETPDRGHDIASDEITHTGRGMTVTFLKFEK